MARQGISNGRGLGVVGVVAVVASLASCGTMTAASGHRAPATGTAAAGAIRGAAALEDGGATRSGGLASGTPTAPCPLATGPGPAAVASAPATHLFTRTTGDGITIRAYRITGGPVVGCEPSRMNQSVVVPGCFGDFVSIELSDATAVGQGDLAQEMPLASMGSSTGVTAAPVATGPAVGSGAFGVVEGDPVWWVAVQVDASITRAEATFSDGSTDAMAPVGGVVVLAHHVTPSATSDPNQVQAVVQLRTADGASVGKITVPAPAPPTPIPTPVPPPSPPTPEPGSTGGGSASSGSTGGGSTGGASADSGSASSGSAVSGTAVTASPPSKGTASPSEPAIACPMIASPVP